MASKLDLEAGMCPCVAGPESSSDDAGACLPRNSVPTPFPSLLFKYPAKEMAGAPRETPAR